MRLFPYLLDAVFPPRETERVVRMGSTQKHVLVPDPINTQLGEYSVTSLFSYEELAVQSCILEAKFHGNVGAATMLGQALCEFFTEYFAELRQWAPLPLVCIPIPLSKVREQQRGYNQTLKIIQACYTLPDIEIAPEILMRIRDTAPQRSCSRAERRTNMENAFAVCSPIDPARTYIVVDDVMTTGSTMLAALTALRNAGAERLLGVTLAY